MLMPGIILLRQDRSNGDVARVCRQDGATCRFEGEC